MEVPDLSELLNVRPTIKLENSGVTFVDETSQDEASDPLSIMPQFVTENDLALMQPEGEILQVPLAVFSDTADDDDTMQSSDSNDEVIVQLMDIRTPLNKLRALLQQRLAHNLNDYTFWLQDAKQLEPHRTLAAQCVRGAGVVQVNIKIVPATKRINILDVLKPDEELLRLPRSAVEDEPEDISISVPPAPECNLQHSAEQSDPAGAVRWVVDDMFRADSARDKVPQDPQEWSVQHVKLWIIWAVRQFNLKGVKLSDWNISGARLCAMTNVEFKDKVPSDPGDIFWTHFELLRKCKFVAIVQNDDDIDQEMAAESQVEDEKENQDKKNVPTSTQTNTGEKFTIAKKKKLMKTAQFHIQESDDDLPYTATRSGNNGQIQLWQFLLELLTSAEYYDIIRWNGDDGQFILLEPERVARLWGLRKHKPAMNYEKLSRALRYYYDGDMIAKVTGQRFVYKFVCDLKQLLGYDANELAERVEEVHNGILDGTYEVEDVRGEELMEIMK